MAKKLKVGDTVFCEKFGPMKHQFKGTISKIYENSALVQFTDFDSKDKIAAGDLHNQAIISLKDLFDEDGFKKNRKKTRKKLQRVKNNP